MQGQGAFDQARRTRGGLGVTDHRFDRADGAARSAGGLVAEHLAQGLKFDFVADTGARAMGFDQFNGVRIDTGTRIGFS
jgi:signal recognition particle GTPase